MKKAKSVLTTTNSNFLSKRGRVLSGLLILVFLFFNSVLLGQSLQSAVGGTYSTEPLSGSTTSWGNVTNAISSNNVYTTPNANLPGTGNYTDYLKVTNFQFTIPIGSIVTGIKIDVERSDANGKSKDYQIRLIKSGIIQTLDKAQSSAWGSADAVQTYGAIGDLWGLGWTVADVNTLGFGFAFSAQRTGGGAQTTLAKVDEIVITVYYTSPLPVELVSFESTNAVNGNLLVWKTASETNNDYFTLEKSEDGIEFDLFRLVKGAGNSTTENTYSTLDDSPLNRIVYYRLSQTDFDGTTVLFNTISVVNNQQRKRSFDFVVSPTIINESYHVRIETPEEELITIQLINGNSELLFTETLLANTGLNEFQFTKPEKCVGGIYYIRIINKNSLIATTKIVFVQ